MTPQEKQVVSLIEATRGLAEAMKDLKEFSREGLQRMYEPYMKAEDFTPALDLLKRSGLLRETDKQVLIWVQGINHE